MTRYFYSLLDSCKLTVLIRQALLEVLRSHGIQTRNGVGSDELVICCELQFRALNSSSSVQVSNFFPSQPYIVT